MSLYDPNTHLTIIRCRVHTAIILIVLMLFAFTTYATSDVLGSPSKVYDLLQEAAARHPVAGNAEGSYLTMRSMQGAIFFCINLVGNFGTVFAGTLSTCSTSAAPQS